MEDVKQLLKSAGIPNAPIKKLEWKTDENAYCIDASDIAPLEAWKKLRSLANESKYWPVIIDEPETLEQLGEQIESSRPSSFTPEQKKEWPWVQELPEDWQEWASRGEKLSFEDWILTRAEESPIEEEMMGEWLGTDPAQNNLDEPDILNSKKNQILLIPVEHFWHVPAFLRYGNWNDCPSPDVHVAALKYWNDRYGAELVGMRSDTVELLLKTAVKEREEAIEVARQLYYYCTDTAPDGFLEFASSLPGAKDWVFWWD